LRKVEVGHTSNRRVSSPLQQGARLNVRPQSLRLPGFPSPVHNPVFSDINVAAKSNIVRSDVRLGRVRPPKLQARSRGLFVRQGVAGLALLAGFAGCLVFAVLSDFGRRSTHVRPFWADIDRMARAVGLGIDQVSVVGHRYTSDGDVFDALDLARSRSFVSFDSGAARSRIEALSWVKHASVSRVLPGQLNVSITEREPYAIWQRGEKLELIDVTGRVLSGTQWRYAPKLPVVTGEGAADEVGPLMRLVASVERIANRLVRAERVSRRRWTLHLTDGVKLHLPAQGEAAALGLFRSRRTLWDFAAQPNQVLDFRVDGRVVVQSAQRPTAAASQSPRKRTGHPEPG